MPQYHGYSYPEGKNSVRDFLWYNLKPGAKILDVGAGGGTYRHLLGGIYKWDAVEVWEPSARFIITWYDRVFGCDIRDFQYTEDYDLIIFGDILEHLSVEDAQRVLKEASRHSKAVLVAVPYCLPQEAINGNEAERHLQPDLTHTIFNERYPGFKRIHGSKYYGYYYRKN